MDDTMKEKHAPLVLEENWLSYFQSVQSNAPPNPAQQFICHELREQEERKKTVSYCGLLDYRRRNKHSC